MSRSNRCPKKLLAGEHLVVQEKQRFCANNFWWLLVVRQRDRVRVGWVTHTHACIVSSNWFLSAESYIWLSMAKERPKIDLNTTDSPKWCYAKPMFVLGNWFCCCICVSCCGEVFGVAGVCWVVPACTFLSKATKWRGTAGISDVWSQHQDARHWLFFGFFLWKIVVSSES